MWNQSPCKGRHYFQDYPSAYKPHIRQHPRTNEGPPAHVRDVVFPVGRGPHRPHVEPPSGMRVSNPYAPSPEMPPSWVVQTNTANQDSSTSSLENLRPPSTSAWPQSVIYLPAELISGMLIPPPFAPPLPSPAVTPSWFVQPNLAKQALAPQPPEPSEDTDDSPMRLPPPPPPPEISSSSNSLPITVKQERSTRAKNWVMYPQVPQAPPEPPSSNIVVKPERSTWTPVDLPSLQLPPNEQLRDPRQLKRSDSDPLHTTTAKLSRDDKANAPNKDGLEDVRKLLALGEKRRIKLEAEEAKLKQSKTSDPDVSRFKKMETHYKDKMKAWAEKYNALKQSYEALRQERGQQVAGQSNSLQMVKNDVDEDERAVNDSLQAEINRLKNKFKVKNEKLQRRQEATFDTEREQLLKQFEEEKKTLRQEHREQIQSYKSRVDRLNRENDHLLESNVSLEEKQVKLTTKLEDFRRKIDELRETLADRDKTIASQKRKDVQ